MKFLILALTFSTNLFAQDFNQEPRYYTHPQTNKVRSEFTDQFANSSQSAVSTTAADPYLLKMANQLAKEIKQKYILLLSYQNEASNNCASMDMLNFVRAQKTAGKFQTCIDIAKQCLNSDQAMASLILADGGYCANKITQFDLADQFYQRATAHQFKSINSYPAQVIKYALYALNSEDSSNFEMILGKQWSGAELKLISTTLKYLNKGILEGGITYEQIKNKVMQLLNSDEAELANLMAQGWMTNLMWNHYDSTGVIKFAEENFKHINDPDAVMRLVDLSFYRQDKNNFKIGKVVLDTYYQFANSYSPLPVENNIFTVTEQYEQICPNTLSQGEDYKLLTQLKNKFKSGSKPSDLILAAEKLNSQSNSKADILTFLGFLYEITGNEIKAEDLYWSSHKLCPYYHRSHWALGGIHKDQRYRAFKDYQQIRKTVDEELTTVEFSPSLTTYVMNWKSLSQDQANGVKHAIKIFAPFMDGLVKADTRLYVKVSFEYESEIPGYEYDRDRRAPAPDNRLNDELRGRGGNPVITDIGETMRSPHGDYNLAAHEIAHSFHYDYLSSISNGAQLQNCITKLYQGATKRGVFAEPYSASHESEYFAQAVGYYLVKENSPSRYGLTVKWLKDNDPDIYNFILSIDQSQGDSSKIQCPL